MEPTSTTESIERNRSSASRASSTGLSPGSVYDAGFETLKLRKENAVLFIDIAAPPMNLLTPSLVRDLVSLIRQAEADECIKVLVFKSANTDYFIAHVDVTRIKEYRKATAKLAGDASLASFFHYVSVSRLVTIAQIEGRTRAAGNEFTMACDMRFAALETAIFAQPETALGLIPGAGGLQHLTRLLGRGRALEVMLGADDYNAEVAERYGWIIRALPAAMLDTFVRSFARRISRFPSASLAEVKNQINGISLAGPDEFKLDSDLFKVAASSPNTQMLLRNALKRGLQTREAEMDLARLLSELSDE